MREHETATGARAGSATRPGDTIEVTANRVGGQPRTGEILEVLGEGDHLHYRVRWEDGSEVVFYPAGNVTIRHPAARALVRALVEGEVGYELIPHRRTATALAEARALELPPERVAKTVVLRSPDGYVRALVPASSHVSLRKVRKLLGAEVRLATEAETAAEYPEFELGAVPPVGGASSDRVVADRMLAESHRLVFEAGRHDESVSLRTEDLLRLAAAEVADIAGRT